MIAQSAACCLEPGLRSFSRRLLEPGVLKFQRLQALLVGHFHAARLRSPLEKGRFYDLILAAQFLNTQFSLALFHNAYELFFAEMSFLHRLPPPLENRQTLNPLEIQEIRSMVTVRFKNLKHAPTLKQWGLSLEAELAFQRSGAEFISLLQHFVLQVLKLVTQQPIDICVWRSTIANQEITTVSTKESVIPCTT